MRVVVAGGGYAGLACLMALHRRHPDADLVLIDPAASHLLLTRLHETLRRPVDDFRRPFGALASAIGFSHRRAALPVTPARLQVWQSTRRLPLADGDLPFDVLVVATGARTPSVAAQAGVIGESVFRSRGGRRLVERVLAAGDDMPLTVVGGGATGLQFLFQLRDVLRGRGAERPLRLVHQEQQPLAGLPAACGDYVQKRLASCGIEHFPGTHYLGQEEQCVVVADGKGERRLPSALTLLFPGVSPSPCALSVNAFGQVLVDGAPLLDVFAAGDCARFPVGSYDALTAQAAVAKGRLVADNIGRSASGRPLAPYRARERGYLVSLGYFDAVGWFGSPHLPVTGVSAVLLKELLEVRYDLSLPGGRP